jgi:hypothetical protein
VRERTDLEIGTESAEAERELSETRPVADDLIERELGSRPKSPGRRRRALTGMENRGGPRGETARSLREMIEELEERVARLRRYYEARRSVPRL